MRIARIANVLLHTGGILLHGGIAIAMAGSALDNALYLFDVGMWMLIAAMPIFLSGAIAAVVPDTGASEQPSRPHTR